MQVPMLPAPPDSVGRIARRGQGHPVSLLDFLGF